MEPETRVCQNCKKDFLIEDEDFQFYKKIDVPPPSWCPECRMKRRLIFWNEHNLYRKKEALNRKEVFCTYPEEANVVIYDHDDWWSDKWDAMSYGKDIDFSRPFLAQVQELNTTVPWCAKSIQQMVNSEYCNQASRDKNCYLCFNGNDSEDSCYGVNFTTMRNSVDFCATSETELSYELFWSGPLYQSFYCVDVHNCQNVWFAIDCRNCQNCVGCVGLRNKQYCILNQQYTKEEYERRLTALNLGSYAANRAFTDHVRELRVRTPVRYMQGLKNVDVVGDYISNSKNIRSSFEIESCENIKFSQVLANDAKDSYDYSNWGWHSELIYDSVSIGENCSRINFSFDCWPNCNDLTYCLNCHSSSDLFGCVGLRSKQYCILNKQYTKEEYETLVPMIIEQMKAMPYVDAKGRAYPYGEFFPSEFSPLAYTEAKVMDYYPLTKEQAATEGFLWRDPNPREFQTTMAAVDLPDHVRDVPDGITKEAIGCENCRRAFRIIPVELQFYRRFGIPLPRRCHNCRYLDRMKNRNPMVWYARACQCVGVHSENGAYQNTGAHAHGAEKCPNSFETTYAPDRPEIVYCEGCYNAEVA